MALTQGEWTSKTVKGRLILECDVIHTTGEIDDVKSTCLSVLVNPNYVGAKVQTTLSGPVIGEINLGKLPYYAFNLDGGETLLAETCHYVIIQ